MTPRPLYCTWDGDAFVPLQRFRRLANADYVVGEVYPLAIHEERSSVSHRHYFAVVHEAWLNLPDELAMEFRTPEALRKRALIEAGFYDERRLVASSPAEARKIAAFLQPASDFAVVSVAGNVVIERKAKSQSVRAMGKKTFQESKTAVLAVLAGMLNVTPDELSAQYRDEAASGDAAGPAEAPARGQAQTDTPPLVPSRPGDGVGTDVEATAPAATSVPLSEYDAQLVRAAQRGTKALREAWDEIPREAKAQLKAALDRRHKPAATRADAERVPA